MPQRTLHLTRRKTLVFTLIALGVGSLFGYLLRGRRRPN